MNKLNTAKLKLSDFLVISGIPCNPDYPNASFIEKISLMSKIEKEVNINAYEMKMVIISLSHVLDDVGTISSNDFLACLLPYKKEGKPKKKKKGKASASELFTFSDSRWRDVRYKALKAGNGSCCLCGSTVKDGVKLHVDHIKPKSLHPHLAYDLNNLQVLCDCCNVGKSNKDDTDCR